MLCLYIGSCSFFIIFPYLESQDQLDRFSNCFQFKKSFSICGIFIKTNRKPNFRKILINFMFLNFNLLGYYVYLSYKLFFYWKQKQYFVINEYLPIIINYFSISIYQLFFINCTINNKHCIMNILFSIVKKYEFLVIFFSNA